MGKHLRGELTVTSEAAAFNNDNVEAHFTNGSDNDTYILHNTIQSARDYDADDGTLWINYVGYQSGTTRFRDLVIGNGKQSAIITVDGSTGNVGINESAPDQKIHMSATSAGAVWMRQENIATSENGNIGGLRGYWDGTEVARFAFRAGPDTSNKDDGKILLSTGNSGSMGSALLIDHNKASRFYGNLGVKKAPSNTLDLNLTTEDLGFVDAGSTSATEQDWIEVTVGGNTGYIRVFSSK